MYWHQIYVQREKAMRKSVVAAYGRNPDKDTYDVDLKNIAPDRVISAPYAEIYEWSE